MYRYSTIIIYFWANHNGCTEMKKKFPLDFDSGLITVGSVYAS